jgi:hypothetical protein
MTHVYISLNFYDLIKTSLVDQFAYVAFHTVTLYSVRTVDSH